MGKTPNDIPTKVGDRIKRRGQQRLGTVTDMAIPFTLKGVWVYCTWDDKGGPLICHQNELQKLEQQCLP